MTTSNGNDGTLVEELSSLIADYEAENEDLVRELETLGITIAEYDQMIAANEPEQVTTDSTVV